MSKKQTNNRYRHRFFGILPGVLVILALMMGCGNATPAPSATEEPLPATAATPAVLPTGADQGIDPAEEMQAFIDNEIAFVEEGDHAIYLEREGNGLEQKLMVCFDGDGTVIAVKERFIGPEGADYSEEPGSWDFFASGQWISVDNQVCLSWDADSVARWFGGLDEQQVQAQLDSWPELTPNRDIALETIPMGQKLYSGNGITLTLESIGFQPGESIALNIAATGNGKDMLMYYLGEVYINGWELGIVGEDIGVALTEEPEVKTFYVGSPQSPAYHDMDIQQIATVGMYIQTIKNGNFNDGEYTATLENPAAQDYVQAYDDSGTVLLDGEGMKVVQRRVDTKRGVIQLYVERKADARWSQLLIDGVFNGYGGSMAGGGNWCMIPKENRAIIDVDGSDICQINGVTQLTSAQVYLTGYRSNKIMNPMRLEIDLPAQGEAEPINRRGEVVFDGDYCTIRYLGVSHGYFSDTDVLLLECENKTGDRYMSIYQAFDYLLLDGIRVKAGMSGANCYPNSITTMALFPMDSEYYDLSAYDQGQLKLGVYQIKGGYHQQLELSGVLSLDLGKTVE